MKLSARGLLRVLPHDADGLSIYLGSSTTPWRYFGRFELVQLAHAEEYPDFREVDEPIELTDPVRPDGDRLPPADANILEALDDGLDMREALAVPRWCYRYLRTLVERLRRPAAAVAIALLSVRVAGATIIAKYTPPDPELTVCQLAIGSSVVAANVIPAAAPCADDEANLCTSVPLSLGPGTYSFQLVCSPGAIVRSKTIRITTP